MSIQTIEEIISNQAIRLWEASGFEVRDVLWLLGICAVSLSLAPFVAFYMLLVA